MGRDPITLMNRYMAATLPANVGSEGFDLTRAALAQLNGIFVKGKVKVTTSNNSSSPSF